MRGTGRDEERIVLADLVDLAGNGDARPAPQHILLVLDEVGVHRNAPSLSHDKAAHHEIGRALGRAEKDLHLGRNARRDALGRHHGSWPDHAPLRTFAHWQSSLTWSRGPDRVASPQFRGRNSAGIGPALRSSPQKMEMIHQREPSWNS